MASEVRKVALVTGGGNGIGRAASIKFSTHGYNVIVADINMKSAEDCVKLLKCDGLAVEVDVTDESQVEEMVRLGVEKFGRIDACFNNAGIINSRSKLDETSLETFSKVMNVNVNGVFLCMKYELKQFLKQEGLKIEFDSTLLDPSVGEPLRGLSIPKPVRGYIVNMSSFLTTNILSCMSTYIASKCAITGLTKTAAVEYSSEGILINSICPAAVATSMVQDTLTTEQAGLLVARIGVGRFGTPEEIAETVFWLCSGKCSFMSGEAVTISGNFI